MTAWLASWRRTLSAWQFRSSHSTPETVQAAIPGQVSSGVCMLRRLLSGTKIDDPALEAYKEHLKRLIAKANASEKPGGPAAH